MEGSEKMKIAMVFDGLRYGGIERIGINYINIFNELGNDVTVFNLRPKLNDMENQIKDKYKIEHIVFPRWYAPECYATIIKKKWWGKYIYPLAYVLFSTILYFYRFILRIKYKSVREKYDIIIAFSGHINDLTFCANSFIKGKKKIAWLHGALYGYAIISPAFLRLYPKIKNLVCLSELCDGEFCGYIEENKINKKKIYNPTYINERNINKDFVKQLVQKYGDFCLMVARIDDDKDQKTAIDAIKILKDKYGLIKKIVLVGNGKNMDKLKRYVEKKQITEQVIFTGARDDVQNYYSAAKVYVHSSPSEGLPTVLLEAMNFRLPIAATDSMPGVREVLKNEKCGLISNIYDAEGLADNIYKLYNDEKLCESLKKAGEQRLKDFMPETIKYQIADFVNKLT